MRCIGFNEPGTSFEGSQTHLVDLTHIYNPEAEILVSLKQSIQVPTQAISNRGLPLYFTKSIVLSAYAGRKS